MEYISAADAAKKLNITLRRLQQKCAKGEIPGAKKEGRRWFVPQNIVRDQNDVKKPLPIGISDYKIAQSEYYCVDKTMLIKEFLERKPLVSLFTRPRRFGKTLNMDMLRVFFEKTEEDNSKNRGSKSDISLCPVSLHHYRTEKTKKSFLFHFLPKKARIRHAPLLYNKFGTGVFPVKNLLNDIGQYTRNGSRPSGIKPPYSDIKAVYPIGAS